MLGGLALTLIGLAAVAAGLVNALAGGGTLLTFPLLVALGVPAVAANITNTVALCPGYLGASLAQAASLRGQRRRLIVLLPAAVLGGVAGAALLLATGERAFRGLVPYLILAATALLAAQEPLRAWLLRRAATVGTDGGHRLEPWAALPVGLAAIYGGYFGAGMSVMVLAVLGLMLDDDLKRANAIKQTVALAVNVAAGFFLVFSGKVVWTAAAVMAVGALLGGALGGRLAGRVRPALLRRMVVSIGLLVGLIYLLRG
jgi:uncharacterized membrane protein YfcA